MGPPNKPSNEPSEFKISACFEYIYFLQVTKPGLVTRVTATIQKPSGYAL